jgi:hypothetical protein
MPTRKLTGMPKAKKGAKYLAIKGSKKGAWHVARVKKRK